jgi:hypothetical protein
LTTLQAKVPPAGDQKDDTSKYRRTLGSWNDKDTNGSLLLISRIPGNLSRVQGFQGTVCQVQDVDLLRRVLNNVASPAALQLRETHSALIVAVANAIKMLHWKDFETLVDLVFRDAGWRRISVLGETMKFADLELEEPVTGDRYQVQVKSEASVRDFERYEREFQDKNFRRLYFVVHTPTQNLSEYQPNSSSVELILSDRLAAMVVDAGLVNWLQDKVR